MNQQHAGTTATEGFGERSLARVGETAAIAVAEQARAAIQARYVMAERRQRDMDDVRVRILKECNRVGFAEVARYSKPVGNKRIEGPSIRFVESTLRLMGNVLIETPTVYDDDEKRIVRVTVTDLETNATYQKDVTVDKTVERRDANGGEVLRSRLNSNRQMVYIVRANEDALATKEAALVSKAIRTLGLRIIPGDLIEEGQIACRERLKKADQENPDAARNKLSDSFAGINVMPSDLKEYLGHDLGLSTPAELQELRTLFAAIRDGEATWSDALATKAAPSAEGDTKAAPPKAVTDLKAKLAEAKTKGSKKSPPPSAPNQTTAAKTAPPAAKSEPKPASSAVEKGEVKPQAPAKAGWEDLDIGDQWTNSKGELHVVVAASANIFPLGKTVQKLDEPPIEDAADGAREGFE